MARIRVLADSMIDRIAAGEVVERPASVVKELLENSLDAATRSIDVLLAAGGKRTIQLTDDGCGMDRDDALLALERHATSKLSRAEDLDGIATLGFRGEALSSIAAVSRLTLRTAECDGEGTEVEVHGGRVRAVRRLGLPKGTSVRVDRLFFNTPPRRKFLRSDATELAHCVRWVTRYALAFPERRFRLSHRDRRLIDAPPTDDRLERIAQVFGRDLAGRLLPFEWRGDGLTLAGYAGRPVESSARREAQHFFVNGRAVQDRVLSHAVSEAYGNTMGRGRHPALFLFMEIDPREVDVNVHPQKTEVRFNRSSRVHDRLRDTIASSLSQSAAVPSLSELRPAAHASTASAVREATLRYLDTHQPTGPAPLAAPSRSAPMGRPAGETPRATLLDTVHESEGEAPTPVVPLAQYGDSYIVAEDAQGLVLVDQHAAHERVFFEKYLAEAATSEVETQRLMFPLTFDLSPHERILLDEEIGEFRRLGFEIEPFGGDAVRLDGIPAVAEDLEPEAFFRELLGEASRARAAKSDNEELRHRLVTTAACRAAIKINHRLTMESMRGLLDDLFHTKNPTTCPHGRPILFRLTLEEIERAFRRR